MKLKYVPILLTLMLSSFGIRAEIVKCTMPDGQEVYTDQACDDGITEVIKLQPFIDQSATTVEQNVLNDLMTAVKLVYVDLQGMDSSLIVILFYLGMSIVSFYLYGNDKYKADKDFWRTPESTLHFFDLLGGWPGGFIAQRMFRHKNGKGAFQVVFWITVIANIVVLVDWNMDFLLLGQLIGIVTD